jgi:hypothetical protein
MENGTMSANDRQVVGNHYKHGGEDHWDRAYRLGLDYFQSQITKYVERCWLKNGVEDLKKAQHFLEKYIELKTTETDIELKQLNDAVRELTEHVYDKAIKSGTTPAPGRTCGFCGTVNVNDSQTLTCCEQGREWVNAIHERGRALAEAFPDPEQLIKNDFDFEQVPLNTTDVPLFENLSYEQAAAVVRLSAAYAYGPGQIKPTGWTDFVFEGADSKGFLFTCRKCRASFKVPADANPYATHTACPVVIEEAQAAQPGAGYVDQDWGGGPAPCAEPLLGT